MKVKKSVIIVGVIVAILGGVIINFGIKTSNTEKTLRNEMPAQTDAVDLYYTRLVEVLVTKGAITKEYAAQNTNFQKEIMDGRYSTGEKTMMWIQEANPAFDASLYKDLMNSVEGLREGFNIEQKKLRDMKLTHDNLIDLFPTSVFVGKRGKIEVQLLTNTETQEARKTGTESTPDLF